MQQIKGSILSRWKQGLSRYQYRFHQGKKKWDHNLGHWSYILQKIHLLLIMTSQSVKN